MLFIIYSSYVFLNLPLLEARAEIQKYFRSFFGSKEHLRTCFWDLLTFTKYVARLFKLKCDFIQVLTTLCCFCLLRDCEPLFLLGWWSKSILVLIEKKGTICCSSKALLRRTFTVHFEPINIKLFNFNSCNSFKFLY